MTYSYRQNQLDFGVQDNPVNVFQTSSDAGGQKQQQIFDLSSKLQQQQKQQQGNKKKQQQRQQIKQQIMQKQTQDPSHLVPNQQKPSQQQKQKPNQQQKQKPNQQQKQKQRQLQQQKQRQLQQQKQRQLQKQKQRQLQQLQQQRRRQQQKQEQQQQRRRQQQKQVQHQVPKKSMKEYLDMIDETLRELASSNAPITQDYAYNARNALVQDYGLHPAEANILLNLRFREYFKYRDNYPYTGSVLIDPLKSPQLKQQPMNQQTQYQQTTTIQKHPISQTTPSRQRQITQESIVTAENVKWRHNALQSYIKEDKKTQATLKKLLPIILDHKKKKIVTLDEIHLLKKLMNGKLPFNQQQIRDIAVVKLRKGYQQRSGKEIQLARFLADANQRKKTTANDFKVAKKMLKIISFK